MPHPLCRALVILLLATWSGNGLAQGRVVAQGVVRDGSGTPVERAEVLVEGTTILVRTGADGSYTLPGIPSGAVRLLARRIGFGPVRRDILGAPGEVLRIDWVLRSSPATMDAITVVGRREPSDARLAGFRARAEAKSAGHFITRERIEQSGSRNVLDALRGIPSVRMGAPARGAGRTVRLRGARCPPLVFLDGFPAAATEFDLESIDLNMVEGLEVYPSSSSLPPEFFSARGLEQCGVIAIWSRPAQARRPRTRAVAQRGDSVAADLVRARARTADQVDQVAELAGGTPPIVYPDSLHRAKVRGEATLEFVVGVDGKVDWRTLRVVSATHPLFAEALRQALSAVRWLPARAGGSPVAQLVVLPAVFDVEERPPLPEVTGARS